MPVHDPNDCPFDAARVRSSEVLGCDRFSAILNIAPIRPGHALVIPKQHVSSLMDLSADDYVDFFAFAREATQVLLEVFETRDFDWSLQDGYDAGQTVPHLHLHLIPRVAGDLEDRRGWYRRLQAPVIDAGADVRSTAGRPRLGESELADMAVGLRSRARDLGVVSNGRCA
jgi:diadenosine tetraphosphate (Ap4A) HIT family hydrolase